jgi:hypothetical protein
MRTREFCLLPLITILVLDEQNIYKLSNMKERTGDRVTPGAKIMKLSYDELLMDRNLVDGLVLAYQQIYGGKPWYEKYSRGEVLGKLDKEMTVAESVPELYLAQSSANGDIVGFCWGYGWKGDIESLTNKVLTDHFNYLPTDVMGIVLNQVVLNFKSKNIGVEGIYYMAEIGVAEGWRSGDIFFRMLLAMGDHQIQKGNERFLAYTLKDETADKALRLLGGWHLSDIGIYIPDKKTVIVGGSCLALVEITRKHLKGEDILRQVLRRQRAEQRGNEKAALVGN